MDTGKPSDRMYSWARIGIRQSGKVYLNTYGFDDKLNATTHLDSAVLLP
ncbi:MAG: hypothetical protein WAX77_10695 [Methylococcaceae bacterium]